MTTGIDPVGALFERRTGPVEELTAHAPGIARTTHAMARRFRRGGKLVVFGNGGSSTDAHHIAVEFVHPVIVGKRALPAISLTADVVTLTSVASERGVAEVFAHQLRFLGEPADIALGLSTDGHCANVLRGLETAREIGMLTVALTGGDGGVIAGSEAVDHAFTARSSDPRIVKETHVTTYHILWELVHVFFEQPGIPRPRDRPVSAETGPRACRGGTCVTCSDNAVPATVVRLLGDALAEVDTGAGQVEEVSVALVVARVGDTVLLHAGEAIAGGGAMTPMIDVVDQPGSKGGMDSLCSFLYSGQTDLDAVLAGTERSTVDKIAEIVALRREVCRRDARRLRHCARQMAERFATGGRLFSFGNGGSSTDAQDLAGLFLNPGGRHAPALPAFGLANDIAVITALSNDISFDVVFSRQIGALARPRDIAVGLSTSGNSANLLRAFEEASTRGLLTVGIAGYDGGKMAESTSIDYLFVVPSPSVHRVQETQTTLYHALWELTVDALASDAGATPGR